MRAFPEATTLTLSNLKKKGEEQSRDRHQGAGPGVVIPELPQKSYSWPRKLSFPLICFDGFMIRKL